MVLEFQDWAANIVDDIIWTSSMEELERRVRKVLQKCRELEITISRKKLNIGNKVTFAGYEVSDSRNQSHLIAPAQSPR